MAKFVIKFINFKTIYFCLTNYIMLLKRIIEKILVRFLVQLGKKHKN